MSGEKSRFISDRREPSSSSWSDDTDWLAGTTENVDVVGDGLVGRTPAQVGEPPNSAVAQFNAQDTASVIVDGGRVIEWQDRTGNGYHLTEGPGATSLHSEAINGHEGIYFDGSGDTMGIFDYDFDTLSPPFSVFIVFQANFSDTESDHRALFHRIEGNNNILRWYPRSNGGGWASYSREGISGSKDTSIQLLTGIFDSTNKLRENGELVASGDTANNLQSISVGSYDVGHSQHWLGHIGLVEVHNGLPDGGVAQREQEIISEWDIVP